MKSKKTVSEEKYDYRNNLVPYQWPWTDQHGNKMNWKSWLWTRKFSIFYLAVIWGIVGVLGYASTRNCYDSWQLAYQCDQAIWMIEYKTDFLSFFMSFFTTPFFHNGLDHILFVSIFGMMMPVQSFEAQNGSKLTFGIFMLTYVMIGLFNGPLMNYSLEYWPESPLVLEGFERNWMGGSVGFYGIIGAMSYTSKKKWFLILMVVAFAAFNRFVLGINLFIPFIHITSAIFGFSLSWIWFRYIIPRLSKDLKVPS
ncbi:MAG: hypothetical protein JXR07_09460 [Reichenbachiella sp.]